MLKEGKVCFGARGRVWIKHRILLDSRGIKDGGGAWFCERAKWITQATSYDLGQSLRWTIRKDPFWIGCKPLNSSILKIIKRESYLKSHTIDESVGWEIRAWMLITGG